MKPLYWIGYPGQVPPAPHVDPISRGTYPVLGFELWVDFATWQRNDQFLLPDAGPTHTQQRTVLACSIGNRLTSSSAVTHPPTEGDRGTHWIHLLGL